MFATEISKKVKEGSLKAVEAVSHALAVIKEKDGAMGAFLEVFEAEALARAAEIDKKSLSGRQLGRLAGVPVAIKDNILYAGHEMTCASRILEGYIAPYSATVVERLLAEDAIIVGRTNMDEFAMGSSCENSAYKKTKNPADAERVPGGSSGGSAAAVAAGMVPISLGSDTGGSVRQPASFCGVTGLKPTYGLVSRYGLTAFASSLDQIGLLAGNAEDCALALSVISGHDERDSTSLKRGSEDYLTGISSGLKGIRIGIPKEYFGCGMDPEVERLVKLALEKMVNAGAIVSDISLPNTGYAVPAYYILASSEASANLARFDGMRYGHSPAYEIKTGLSLKDVYLKSRGVFGAEVKRRIMLGTYALSSGYYEAYYVKAQKTRTLIKKDFDNAFAKADLILGPTTPTAAFKFGEKTNDPVQMYLSDIYAIPCNMAGITGVSVPCGKTAEKLPVGMQLLAKPFNEAMLFRAAHAYEKV